MSGSDSDKNDKGAKPYKKSDGFTINGYEDPPPIPEQGFTVPGEIVKLAFELRKRCAERPAEIPQRWFVWITEYTQAHPYAVKLKQRREDHHIEENSFQQTSPEVEKEKGRKLNKVLVPIADVIGKIGTAVAKEVKDAYSSGVRDATKAFEAGAKSVTDAHRAAIEERRQDVDEDKNAFAAVNTALESVSGLAEKMFEGRHDDLDDRRELLELLREAQGDAPKGSAMWDKIGKVGQKLVKVFAPAAKKAGLDLAPFMPELETTELAKREKEEE